MIRLLLAVSLFAGALATAPTALAGEVESLCQDAPTMLSTDVLQAASLEAGQVDCYEVLLGGDPPELRVELEGPTGDTADLDLYVRHGGEPTRRTFDCRGFTRRSFETCLFDRPKTGSWFIAVVAVGTGGDYGIAAVVGGCLEIRLEEAVGGIVRSGEQDCFAADVPSGQDVLRVELEAMGDSDADLEVRLGRQPGEFTPVDCASLSLSNSEACILPVPEPGRWFVLVRGYRGISEYELLLSTRPCALLTADRSPVTRQAGGARADCWRTDIGGAEWLRAGVDEKDGADVKLTLHAARVEVCEQASRARTAERCGIGAPADGRWYAVVEFVDIVPRGSVDVFFEAGQADPLVTPVAVVSIGSPGDIRLYRLAAAGRAVVATLSGPVGADFDIYASRAWPATADPFDGRCARSGASARPETCTVDAGPGDVYLLVRAASGSGEAILTAQAL